MSAHWEIYLQAVRTQPRGGRLAGPAEDLFFPQAAPGQPIPDDKEPEEPLNKP